MNKTLFIIFVLGCLALASFSIPYLFSLEETNNIAVLQIKGAISSTGSGTPLQSGGASSSKIIKQLEKVEKDSSIKGVILEIDSPGGAVLPSKEITEKILKMEKPVVAWIRGTGASGAYWIATGSDHIIADELSIVGSIGVVSSYLEFSDLLEEYGVTYERLVTGEYKDTKTPFKKLTEKERKYFMKKLEGIHDYFVKDVAANRNMTVAEVNRLATGEIFLGQEAIDLGLIDEIGGKEEAINATKKLAGIEEAELIKYKESTSFFQLLIRF